MCKQRKRKTTQKSCRVGTKSLCLSKRLISRVTSANPAISGTLASLVRPQLRSPAFDRVLQGQNELARRAVLLSLYSAGRTKPSVPLRHHRRGTWPCLTSTAFPAFPAANDWIAPALLARREHYLDATRHRPDEMRLPRCRVATSSRREIPARPAPIAKRQHKPTPTQGGFQAYPAAGAAPLCIPFPPQAFSARRNSFLPWLDGLWPNQDRLPTTYRSSASRAGRWRGRDNKADRDHWGAFST